MRSHLFVGLEKFQHLDRTLSDDSQSICHPRSVSQPVTMKMFFRYAFILSYHRIIILRLWLFIFASVYNPRCRGHLAWGSQFPSFGRDIRISAMAWSRQIAFTHRQDNEDIRRGYNIIGEYRPWVSANNLQGVCHGWTPIWGSSKRVTSGCSCNSTRQENNDDSYNYYYWFG